MYSVFTCSTSNHCVWRWEKYNILTFISYSKYNKCYGQWQNINQTEEMIKEIWIYINKAPKMFDFELDNVHVTVFLSIEDKSKRFVLMLAVFWKWQVTQVSKQPLLLKRKNLLMSYDRSINRQFFILMKKSLKNIKTNPWKMKTNIFFKTDMKL